MRYTVELRDGTEFDRLAAGVLVDSGGALRLSADGEVALLIAAGGLAQRAASGFRPVASGDEQAGSDDCAGTVLMAGRMEREAHAAATGLTGIQRDKMIVQLRRRGLTQAEIAKRVGLTQTGVKRALDRLAGVARQQRRLDMCDACWGEFYYDELNSDGLCKECAEK